MTNNQWFLERTGIQIPDSIERSFEISFSSELGHEMNLLAEFEVQPKDVSASDNSSQDGSSKAASSLVMPPLQQIIS